MGNLGNADYRNDGIVEVQVKVRWTIKVNLASKDPDGLDDEKLWEMAAGVLCRNYAELMSEMTGSTVVARRCMSHAWMWDETADRFLMAYEVVFER